MWEQVDYEFHGEHFTVPYPHNVLPKPYGQGHPPIWVACGNPPTFARAGELGIGAIAFNFEPIYALRGRIEVGAELGKRGHFAVLRKLALDAPRHLLHRLGLRGGPHARHRKTDVHRRAYALVEKVGLQKDLPVRD